MARTKVIRIITLDSKHIMVPYHVCELFKRVKMGVDAMAAAGVSMNNTIEVDLLSTLLNLCLEWAKAHISLTCPPPGLKANVYPRMSDWDEHFFTKLGRDMVTKLVPASKALGMPSLEHLANLWIIRSLAADLPGPGSTSKAKYGQKKKTKQKSVKAKTIFEMDFKV